MLTTSARVNNRCRRIPQIVVMNAVGLTAALGLIFGTAYLVVTYSLWWLLLLLAVPGIKFPSSGGLR